MRPVCITQSCRVTAAVMTPEGQKTRRERESGGVDDTTGKKTREVGKGDLGGLGFPWHPALTQERKPARKPHPHMNAEVFGPAAGPRPTPARHSPQPRVAPRTNTRAGPASFLLLWQNWCVAPDDGSRRPPTSPCRRLQPPSLLLWWRSWCGVVTRAACNAARGTPSLDWIISSGSLY